MLSNEAWYLFYRFKDKLNYNQSSPNAISHKQLNEILKKAKKEALSIDNTANNEVNKTKEFNDLIQKWADTSQKILLTLNKGDEVLKRDRSPKSLIAFGAMGSHINMALQALKSAEFDQ